MSSSQQRIRDLKGQFGGPVARLRFAPAIEREFLHQTGAAFVPVARTAFLAVLALIVVIVAADWWLMARRVDAVIVAVMLSVEFPLMIGLYIYVGRLKQYARLPNVMTALMLFQCFMFCWVTARVAAPGDAVPYLYEVMVLYLFFLFFFTGVMFYPAVLLGTLAVTVSAIAYLYTGIQPAAVVRAALFLLASAAVGVVVRYLMERLLRIEFLHRAISEEASRTDPLTDLLNRRGFEQGLNTLLRHAKRDHCPVGLLMIDLDNFKQVNDTMGHAQGDALLVAVSRVLEGFARRPLDLACRSGGDEFVLALHDAPESSIPDLAGKLRGALCEHVQPWKKVAPTVGVSVGAVWFAPGDAPADVSAMLEVLDRALYDAKRAGKGQVKYHNTGSWDDASALAQAPY